MQWCHPIIGSDAWICPTALDQVLDNLQMTFLAGQVEWCGTIFSLGVDKAVEKMYLIYCLGITAIFRGSKVIGQLMTISFIARCGLFTHHSMTNQTAKRSGVGSVSSLENWNTRSKELSICNEEGLGWGKKTNTR